ncbi:MAG TPA: hypothetical protein VEH76_03740 [Methylocystis sp.]|nr:hypothetical protein [Methylocystis sp.]
MNASYRIALGFAAAIVVAFAAAPAGAAESQGGSRGSSPRPRVVGVISGPTVVVVQPERVVYQRPLPAAPPISPASACPTQRETYVDGAGVSHSQIRRSCF